MLYFLVIALVPDISEAMDWMHLKCKGEVCDNPEFPIIDYNGEKCICRRHPCWDDNGKQHSCGPQTPFLTFSYMADGALICSCRKFPHIGSVYIHQTLCPGETCDAEATPILEYDETKRGCTCNSHPCLNDNGKAHSCNDEKFPLLTYSYDK